MSKNNITIRMTCRYDLVFDPTTTCFKLLEWSKKTPKYAGNTLANMTKDELIDLIAEHYEEEHYT